MSEFKKEELIKENVSGNIKAQNKEIEILKNHFSNCFDKDGNFNFEKFKDLMTEKEVNFSSESYVLNWLGKSYARFLINEETTTFLRENKTHNEKPENINSQNILIKGDNLEVLKHLSGAYYEKIKMIYIDPPYNTGKDDFMYQDSRKYTAQELMDKIGINQEKALKIIEFTQSRSNSHSAWMTFIYPRLYIAKQLLKDDGFIFVSIDDNEMAQLKLIMDEIFGEENFVSCSVVVNNRAGRNYGSIAKQHEYLIIYSKKPNNKLNWIVEENKEFWGKDEIGEYNLMELRNRNIKFSNKESAPNLFYPFYVNPNKQFSDGLYEISLEKKEGFIEVFPLISQGVQTVWRWGKKKTLENLNKEIFAKKKKDGNFMIVEKYRRKDKMQKSVWDEKEFITQNGAERIKKLFNFNAFDYSKPLFFIKRIIELSTNFNTNDIVLDFFAGSGTTGDAVMQLNAEDGGNRKYILVQFDEPIKPRKNKEAYNFVKNELKAEPTIFEITKERLIRAAKNIKEEINNKIIEKKQKLEEETDEEQRKQIEEEINNLEKQDLGFQVFETFPIWNNYVIPEEYDPSFEVFDGNNLSHEDLMALLTTWKVYDGMPLTQKLTEVDLDGYTAYYSSEKKKMYLMFGNFSTKNLIALLRKVDMDKTFDLKTVVLFGYTIPANMIFELSQNFKTFKRRTKIDLKRIIRY